LEYTPYGLTRSLAQLAKATIRREFSPEEQREFARVFGRGVTGTFGVITLGYVLAARGLMTGFYDDDEKKKEALRRSAGQQPASIRLGNRWYQVSGLAPLGTLLALGATIHRETHEQVKEEEERPLKTLKASTGWIMDLP